MTRIGSDFHLNSVSTAEQNTDEVCEIVSKMSSINVRVYTALSHSEYQTSPPTNPTPWV